MNIKKSLTWKNRNVTVPETDGVFLFFHWNIDMKENKKKDKIKYNHHYPTCSLSMPCYFMSEQSASHGKQEVLSQNCSTVQSRRSTVSRMCPHTAPCGSLRGTGGTGTRSHVSLAVNDGKLVMSSLDEPRCRHSPFLFSVTLPPWHCHCQELPHILYFPLFLKVTLSLKRKVLIFIQRKKKRAFQPLLWVHSQS